MATKQDARQVVLRAQSPFIGNAVNEQLDVVFPRIDAEMAKLYEDRNVLLTDGGIITFTGTQILFTENLNLILNQKISGAAPQVFNLGQATITLANNEMLWTIINRTAGTATLAQGSTMPAVIAANQEVFLLVKRVDAGDGTQRIYWRTGAAFNAGQSARLGSAGSGSGGSGVGDDLDALLYRASFRDGFDEGTTDSKSAVDASAGKTDPLTYSAAKALFQLSYDASKTIAAGTTTTNINISAVAAFTVKIGDLVIANNQARRITAVATQASFTTEAFSVAPTLAAQVTVSQAVYTKDIYNLAVDGNALSAAFSGQTFSDIMVDYEDTSTVGDAIFDVNTAPVIAFSASNDNTNFTNIQNRPTLETTTVTSVTLPSSGTALYMRFFALKTSGSGSVNILGYRAFMQKATSAGTSGGITNSAYAFTNGVGTPINASLSVVGGKTVVTLTWQYAVGVYSGTTASSIEVWLNGSKLPRFVNSTLTPDGSFLESSSSSITLDRDYSSQNLSVEIFQRTQIVDNSTTNTTAISSLQEISQNGFSAFTNANTMMNATTSAGTPAAGTFYSSVIGRAAMLDLSQDLKVRFGSERHMVQFLTQTLNESGPNGEPVYLAVNDLFGAARFVGSGWYNQLTSYGGMFVNGATGDYFEVTFFGTAMNILCDSAGSTKDWRVSIDGAAEGSNVVPLASTTTDLNGTAFYAPLEVLNVASGLTLGIHTVKIRSNSTANLNISGWDIINDSTNLRINPGTSYVNGSKLFLSAAATPTNNSAFDTGTLGTAGGHVVVYQKADGTIGKAVNPASGTQLNLTSADHSNEEVARVYNFREFGAGRGSDDYTSLNANTSTNQRAFTLDDNVTSLLSGDAYNSKTDSANILDAMQNFNGANTKFIFVGTGLDLLRSTGNSASNTIAQTIFVDNVSVGTIPAITVANVQVLTKIVSGLPYGTHSVTISRTGGSTQEGFSKFVVYQPKKPAIPTGAVELAEYNLLANYSGANITGTTLGDNFVFPTGTIYHSPRREWSYIGANQQYFPLDVTSLPGYAPTTLTNNGQPMNLWFFGTGFVLHMGGTNAGTYDYTVTVDGSLNATGVARSNSTNLGGGSYRSTSSTAYLPTRVEFTGLTLGMHKIVVSRTAGTGNFTMQGIHVITPIHSHKSNLFADFQNTLTVGAQSISDSRKQSPVQGALTAYKAWSKAVGNSSAPSTTSTSPVPMPDMSCTIKTSGGPIKISFNASFLCGSGQEALFQLYVNGIPVDGVSRSSTSGSAESNTALSGKVQVPAGVHKVDAYWLTTAGTLTAVTTSRFLLVEET